MGRNSGRVLRKWNSGGLSLSLTLAVGYLAASVSLLVTLSRHQTSPDLMLAPYLLHPAVSGPHKLFFFFGGDDVT